MNYYFNIVKNAEILAGKKQEFQRFQNFAQIKQIFLKMGIFLIPLPQM